MNFEHAFRELQKSYREKKDIIAEARELVLRIRSDCESRRLLLKMILDLADIGVTHLQPEDAYRLQTIKELASKGVCLHTPDASKAREMSHEARILKQERLDTALVYRHHEK